VLLAGKQMKNAFPTLCVLAQEQSCDHDECGSQDLDKLQQQWQAGMISTRKMRKEGVLARCLSHVWKNPEGSIENSKTPNLSTNKEGY
jgi:hypothetical protein